MIEERTNGQTDVEIEMIIQIDFFTLDQCEIAWDLQAKWVSQ